MNNFNSNSNDFSSLFSSTNYFNDMNSNFNGPLTNNNNNNSNRLLNMRRSSLGNMNSYDESAFVQFNVNNMNQLIRPSIPLSPVYPNYLQNFNNQEFGNLNNETFHENDHFNFDSELASSPNMTNSFCNNNSSSPGLSNSYLLSQIMQQQKQQQLRNQQESLMTNSKNFSNSFTTQSNEPNFIFPPAPSSTPRSAFAPVASKANLRRRSYHFGQINSLLQPVQESGAISPINSNQLKYQQQQREVESRINLLINSASNNKNQTQNIINSSFIAEQNNKLSSINQQPINAPTKQRMRACSIGGGSLCNSISSFLSDFSQSNGDSTNLSYNNICQSKSLSNLNATSNKSFLNFRKLDSFEEKLATTGNIFQKRDDWSIINKLPVNKQNTIHMRLEDEGPFGNDEIRCFVLSHFSSLGVKELTCVFCDCNLIIYDRFPLIDGTLFISPYNYDSAKSISTQIPNKSNLLQHNLFSQSQTQLQQQQPYKQSDLFQQKEKDQYIYGICLKCMMREKDHDIKCKNCKKSWPENGGTSLQIGTLYKYDIFAAFPCCQKRLNCSNCDHQIINIDAGNLQYFSSYSEERECNFCKRKAHHFIKPLEDIFIQSSCHKTKKNMSIEKNVRESHSSQNDLEQTNESFEKFEKSLGLIIENEA